MIDAIQKEALDYLRSKQLKTGFDYRDEHAHMFIMVKAMHLDVLMDIRESLVDTLADSITFREFSKRLILILIEKGWWGEQEATDPVTGKTDTVTLDTPRRLRTIYNANLRIARAAGQWERIEHRKRTHPYLVYELGPSKEHRLQHTKWAGITLPTDDPWWQTHFPPNGWGCKCRVRAVSKREYERLVATGNYSTQAPKVDMKEWVNKRTGGVEKVPVGIDPGWDTNLGRARAA